MSALIRCQSPGRPPAPARRWIRRAALAFFLASLGGAAAARTGGPDAFGYTFRDSAEPGVTYAWEDISVGATDITLIGDDVNMGLQPLSFAFPYYGNAYTSVAACTNGWVSVVDGTATAYTNVRLPAAAVPNGTIAVFWDDLVTRTGLSRVLFRDFSTHAVITWENVPDLGNDASVNTFQVILYADGRIKAQYSNLTGVRTECTAGIESPDNTVGLTAWFDDPAGIPASSYAIEYAPPVPVPPNLDCTNPRPLSCGSRVQANLATEGVANQDAYRCTLANYAGREIVYEMTFATPTDVRLVLEASSGNPDMIVVPACNPNACLSPPTDSVTLRGLTGTVHVVVDAAAGAEGAFTLRADCLPLASRADCAGATALVCGTQVTGDTSSGLAQQDAYACTLADYAGREQVYRLDLRAPTRVEFRLTELSGDPDLILINACDPNTCQVLDSGSLVVDDLNGSVYVVVDSPPGQEGAYELAIDCLSDTMPFCGTGMLEMDPWGYQSGVWLVNGWLYHPGDTHDFALRVDSGTTYSTGGGCLPFPSSTYGVRVPSGPAFTEWGAPEGTVRTTFSQTTVGACCGLLVNMAVTNTDAVPHSYEFRAYHDTAFGTGDGAGLCGAGSTIDGGHIEIAGTRFDTEVNLLSVGGDTCAGQVQMFSADHPSQLRASYQMLPPNLPNAMEYLDWNDGGAPCTTWKGLADGTAFGGCPGSPPDNSVLFIWRFPQFGQLMPGQTATASYRIGLRCAFPCDIPCESPAMTTATAVDARPCQGGILVSWNAATFPGAGNGVYHVYRSTVSHADALTRPPLTPAGGVGGTSWVDDSSLAGPTYFYVVMAESLDFPDCGTGPAVNGSTATADAPGVVDLGDVDPPATEVGPTLRAVGKTPSTVDFEWLLAPPPAADEHYVVLRSDDDPRGPFLAVGSPAARMWTDPDAPPRYSPTHVWFYDVRVADACGNISLD